MGEAQIPFLNISREALDLEQGSEGWKGLSFKVREACEIYGCFLLKYDKIPRSLREDTFMAMKTLFDLPKETKEKYKSPRPYSSYSGNCPPVPLRESFGIDDAPVLHRSQAFTNLMWPDGNPTFCGVLNSMSSKMLELNFMIMKMILKSFGIEKYYESHVENSCCVFRVMKYSVTPSSDNPAIGLVPHTDNNDLTILCQDEVQGLEVLSKSGNWIQVMVPEGSFVVIVGDALKAWSNGRIHAVRHRVVLRSNKERYCCGLFSHPKEGAKIEVPQELVDNDHPLLYGPFIFSEYVNYFVSNSSPDAIEPDSLSEGPPEPESPALPELIFLLLL